MLNLHEKCIVYGCTNHKDGGKFIGDICAPCYTIITTGKVGPTDSFLGHIYKTLKYLLVELTPEQYTYFGDNNVKP